jgi:hypothetical protein
LIVILATSVLLLAQPTLTQQQRVTLAIPRFAWHQHRLTSIVRISMPPILKYASLTHMGSIATRMALAVKLPKQSLSHIQLKVG